MKNHHRLLSILGIIAVISLTACSEDSLSVDQYSNNHPTTQPLIARMIGNDYTYKSREHESLTYKHGFTNGNLRTDRITLKWNKVSDADFLCYKIYRGAQEIVALNNQNTTEFTDKNLISGNDYDYKIVVINSTGISKQDTILLKTAQKNSPNGFQNYISANGRNARLFWHNRAESATKYKVSTTRIDSDTTVTTVSDTLTSFACDSNRTYSIKVVAMNDWEILDSATTTILTKPTFVAPTLQTVEQPDRSEKLLLKWIDNSNSEDKVLIYRKIGNSGTYSKYQEVTGNTAYYYLDTQTPSNNTYYYKLKSVRTSTKDTTGFSSEISKMVIPVVNDSTYGFDANGSAEFDHFVTTGNSKWTLHANSADEDTYFGNGCLKSGIIQPGQKSILKKVIKIKNNISINFKYKISTKDQYDGLALYVNGVYKWSATGWTKWSSKDISSYLANDLSTKVCTLEWVYYRGSTTGGNSNQVFLDNIEIKNN